MNQAMLAGALSLALFLGMLGCLELGRRLGLRRLVGDPDGVKSGTGPVDSAVFALLGLLIAFTYSSAATRYEVRRQLIVQESNNIGTAYLRLDLLPAQARVELQQLFREYLDSRLQTYQLLADSDAARAEYGRSVELQGRIWSRALEAAVAVPGPAAQQLLVPALNDMFDIANTRRAAILIHQPQLVFGMLIAVALCAAVLAGHSLSVGRARSWIHIAAFGAVTAVTLYVILDLEFPRYGLIRVDDLDLLLRDARASMK